VHLVGTVERCLLCDIIYCSAVQAGSFHTLTSGLPNLLLVLPSLHLVLLIYFWFCLFTSGSAYLLLVLLSLFLVLRIYFWFYVFISGFT